MTQRLADAAVWLLFRACRVRCGPLPDQGAH